MKFIPKKISVIAGFMMMLGTFMAVAPLASAAPSCTSGRVCIWNTASYGGDTVAMSSPGVGACKTMPYSWAKNMMSSSYNNISGRTIWWYDGDGCTGAMLFAQPPGYTATPSSANNRANSFQVRL